MSREIRRLLSRGRLLYYNLIYISFRFQGSIILFFFGGGEKSEIREDHSELIRKRREEKEGGKGGKRALVKTFHLRHT